MLDKINADRRTFIRRGAMGAGALWMGSLGELMGRRGYGTVHASSSPYGPPSPKLDRTTGLPLIQLPDGFRYASYSWTGDPLAGGVACPSLHDGMAVVQQGALGRVTLVRNHEPGNGTPYLVNRPGLTYAGDGAGGTTNLVFNTLWGRWERAWPTLAGTVRNCAGGVTPWGTWITCEETTVAGHGWNFEVNAFAGNKTPLYDMGRFSHEALMVDQETGYVYETEDAGDSGFYKFVPNVASQLHHGGNLYMMKVKDVPNADLGVGYAVNTTWDVEWVRIDDPLAQEDSTYEQGAAKGGARFRRLEGAWWGDRTGYFLSTDGGSVAEGQVFEYNPEAETLTLIYDAPSYWDCDNPDNLTVTPRGGLLLCEDAAGGQGQFSGERLIGLTLDGQTFTFAINNVQLTKDYNAVVKAGDYRGSEWAGACYSPDGRWLFVNIQTPGITFAITGPWGSGPL